MKINKIAKKIIGLSLIAVMSFGAFTACGGSDAPAEGDAAAGGAGEEVVEGPTRISVITREDGSGTRGAFTEIVGLIDDNDMDMTTMNATVFDGTGNVMTAVASDPAGMGYISMGSLNETVKGLSIEGVEPTVDNIKSGDYKLARPFNIAYKEDGLDEVSKDLIAFIQSAEAAPIIDETGVISMYAEEGYTSTQPTGNITIGGSTSVTPTMEKIVEAYKAINPNATIAIESQGSTAGMTGATDGTFNIGMASRELKDAEKAELQHMAIATDGICVIVNNDNPLENITFDQIKAVYTEEITNYAELN